MPSQDTSSLKERIITIIRRKGPTLPVYIAKEVEMSILFTSAFLSELLSDKKIKISHMRVGNSPIYFIEEQKFQLEKFSNYLKSKEKDAFLILKEKKFLKDIEQSPAIRVALRAIRDFAIPFKKNEEIIWRYFTISEAEYKSEPRKQEKIIEKEETKEKIISPINIEKKEEIKTPIQEKPKQKIKKVAKKKTPSKQNTKFFNKIKEFLSKETIEILGIESFDKNEILLRIKSEGEEKLLVAYNKKRILDTDIINANKKASQLNLKYTILSMGDPAKKLSNLIESIQNLEKIEKIEK